MRLSQIDPSCRSQHLLSLPAALAAADQAESNPGAVELFNHIMKVHPLEVGIEDVDKVPANRRALM